MCVTPRGGEFSLLTVPCHIPLSSFLHLKQHDTVSNNILDSVVTFVICSDNVCFDLLTPGSAADPCTFLGRRSPQAPYLLKLSCAQKSNIADSNHLCRICPYYQLKDLNDKTKLDNLYAIHSPI